MAINYFDLFSIPPNLHIDPEGLRKTLRTLSLQYHPDKQTDPQTPLLHTITEINLGYDILRDFHKRLSYLLLLHYGQEYKMEVDKEFLMDMLDINEAIMEYKADPNAAAKEKIYNELNDWENNLKAACASIFAAFHLHTAKDEDYTALKNYLARKKYLDRLRTQMETTET